ncbi:MAG TPA: carboxypeptidase-like regulatory domain-containing protein [Terriglobia bacterium]|nr:carboxypeptidase-like regulatory domain-containing protein [Terriglobia bacterium]
MTRLFSGRAARAALRLAPGFGVRLSLAALIAAGIIYFSAFGGVSAAPQSQGAGYITGVVRSSQGPESGVWVIAETKELPTNLIKIVVTDDQGQFMLPDLPNVNYSVWVRGYGLVDSMKRTMKPSTERVFLEASVARTPQEKAQIYPGNYWMSLMEPPAASKFPMGTYLEKPANWMHTFKSSCNFCHQLGNAVTRDLDHVFKARPELHTPEEAWDYRLRAGVRGVQMSGVANLLDRDVLVKMMVDWTTRISKGEVPAEAPARPKGLERNLVLTLWDWGTDHSFMHDENSTAKNKPSVNANGPVYAVSAGHGTLVVLDPQTNSTHEIEIPTRDPRASVPSRFPAPNPDSVFWGKEHLWSNPPYNPADPHNPMIDNQGRVWLTSRIRDKAPAWCSDAAASKYAAYEPLTAGGRQASYYDPRTNKFQLIETCASTHHLQFDTDANQTVYFNELIGPIFSWVDTKVYDQTLAETKDEFKAERAAVGWCPQVLDTNGDGKITKPWNIAPRLPDNATYAGDTAGGPNGWANPTEQDPKRDTKVAFYMYSIIPSPTDHSIWGVAEVYPGYLVRLERGKNPPETCKVELYRVPSPGLDPRGVDIDRNGVVWTALAASSHLASFDRRKCKNLKGPARLDGQGCPEGWTLYETNGPKFKGTDFRTDFHYYNWVDQYDVMKFGVGTPMATGSNSDSILVLNPKNGQWTTLRVPYPLGFYSRGMDARIDDAGAGWKGRALWANYGTHFVWHIEGGKGTKGKIVKFQIRPDPMAR